jgi:hypothetical protein
MLFGMSLFISFAVIGTLFYAGAFFHIENNEESQYIILAVFTMVLGAISSG